MYANILVPIDGSVGANQALEEAFRLAKIFGSKIAVIHVVEHDDAGSKPAASIDEAQQSGHHILENARKRLEAAGIPGLTRLVRSSVAPKDVAATILHVAQESKAELVVIGSLGKVGNVAEKVMNQCPLPVWIIRGGLPGESGA